MQSCHYTTTNPYLNSHQDQNLTVQIHAVVVGADRVAANGDTANKIGTLQIATIANSRGCVASVISV